MLYQTMAQVEKVNTVGITIVYSYLQKTVNKDIRGEITLQIYYAIRTVFENNSSTLKIVPAR